MTTNVEIVEAEKKDALVVPVLAVSLQHMGEESMESATEASNTDAAATQKSAGTQKKVGKVSDNLRVGEGPFPAQTQVVKPDGTMETRDIQVGRNDGQDYVVLSGLQEGESVLLNKLGNTKWKSSTKPKRAPDLPHGM